MKLHRALIPDGLVQALEGAQLVLFVGAGVSRRAPSCLPLLEELASIAEDELGVVSGLNAGAGNSLSAVERLDRLATEGLGVHEAVAKIISRSGEPNAAHESVSDLAQAMGTVRIVTTNYDRHLSKCLPEGTRVYEAPDFPGDSHFSGVVHLHGSICQEPKRLVVTNDDFARSYMQWNSPTLSFLHRLFATQTVLFIGYSLEDPLMQYILRATESSTGIYALTDNPGSPLWKELGVEPVGYDSHDNLPVLLSEWAERSTATVEYHKHRVAAIMAGTLDIEDLSAEDESYLSDLIADTLLVHIFTDQAKGPLWLRWAGTRPDAKFFTPSVELGPADKTLADWFITHHNADEETTTEALGLIVENGGRLHETLWLNIVGSHDPRGGATRETSNRLLLVLADAAPATPELAGCLLNLLNSCDTPEDDDLLLELVDRTFTPKLTPLDPLRHFLGGFGQFQTATADPANGWLHETPDKEFWSRRNHLASLLLGIVDGHLRRVSRIEKIAGNYDPFEGRLVIEDHEQNQAMLDRYFLVDAARDLFEVLAEDKPQDADFYLSSWSAASPSILNRLAIHGWAQRQDASADAKIEWLLQQGWASDIRMHHETMRLIAVAAPGASEGNIRSLTDQIASNPKGLDPKIIFNMLGWIAQHSPHEIARQAFQQAQEANPEMEMSNHPDFLYRWIDGTGITPRAQHVDGMSPEDIVDRIADDSEAAAADLLAVANSNSSSDSMTREWFLVIRACQKAARLSPESGLALLRALAEHADRQPEASRELASSVLLQLTDRAAARQIAREHMDEVDALLKVLWHVGAANWSTPTQCSPWQGWLQEAINSWPGNLVFLFLQKIIGQMAADPSSWDGLPEPDKRFLEEVIEGDSDEAKLAQAICTHNLETLHAVDREWTVSRLFPLMDPADDLESAVRCWDAYLPSRRWAPQFLQDGLLSHFTYFSEHIDQCCPKAQRGFSFLAAELCLSADLLSDDVPRPWLRQFTARASVATRTDFIRSVWLLLRDQDPEHRAAQWGAWMREYWQDRIEGIPRPLSVPEASALADWAILLNDDFPTAVDMACESGASLQEGSMLPYEMHRTVRGTGRFNHLIDQHPAALARQVSNLLENTEGEIAQNFAISMTPLIRELKDRSDDADFQPLQDQARLLGWGYAVD